MSFRNMSMGVQRDLSRAWVLDLDLEKGSSLDRMVSAELSESLVSDGVGPWIHAKITS